MSPKHQKQPKATTPQLLFHEVLGKELSQKFLDLATKPASNTPTGTFLGLDAKDEQSICLKSTTSLSCGFVVAAQILTAPSQIMLSKKAASVAAEKKKTPRTAYELEDLNALQSIERLLGQYGRMTHMGVRDHSYHFYLSHSRDGVLSYRLINKVAIISGDPICPVVRYADLLEEFRQHCKTQRWQYAITGASSDMLAVAKDLKWTTVHFAKERAVNVQNNPVLLGAEGKRIRTQCKQLLNKGTKLGIYCSAYGRKPQLEQEITDLYETWRAERNNNRSLQAYVTVFDMFALHRLMVFVYATDAQGKITGFSALRKLKDGYHVDPLIARADAPRGIVDLLLVSSMAFLREAGIERLVLGVEPLDDLGEITGMSRPLEHLTRKSHRIVSNELHLGGKKGFNDRFKPDEAMEEQLYMLYPNSPSMRQSVAMAHFANIKLHSALKQKYSRQFGQRKRKLLHSQEQTESGKAETKEVGSTES